MDKYILLPEPELIGQALNEINKEPNIQESYTRLATRIREHSNELKLYCQSVSNLPESETTPDQ